MADTDVSKDTLLDGRVVLNQPVDGYRVAIDPVFLAAAVPATSSDRILDAGAGTGAAFLCLAARVPACKIVGIEMQRDLLKIANGNIMENGLTSRVEMISGDLSRPPPRISAASFDHVMTNPPFLEAHAASTSPSRQRALAHHESRLDLAHWLSGCINMLRPGGMLTLIHRADRLGDLLAALDRKIGEILVFPLWPKGDGRPAKRILVQGTKGMQGPMQLTQGLVLHEDDGHYSQTAEEVLRGGRGIALNPMQQGGARG